jgi:hypothetical protein
MLQRTLPAGFIAPCLPTRRVFVTSGGSADGGRAAVMATVLSAYLAPAGMAFELSELLPHPLRLL